jgi:hypothetical protein
MFKTQMEWWMVEWWERQNPQLSGFLPTLQYSTTPFTGSDCLAFRLGYFEFALAY